MRNRFLKHCDNTITSLNTVKHGGRMGTSRLDYLWRIWRIIAVWGPFLETEFGLLLMRAIALLPTNEIYLFNVLINYCEIYRL